MANGKAFHISRMGLTYKGQYKRSLFQIFPVFGLMSPKAHMEPDGRGMHVPLDVAMKANVQRKRGGFSCIQYLTNEDTCPQARPSFLKQQ